MEAEKVYIWDPEVDKSISVVESKQVDHDSVLLDRSKSAFEHFENVSYKCGPGIDFRKGFVVGAHSSRSKFEFTADGKPSNESPLQRLSRLQGEVADMVSYLQTLDQSNENDEIFGEKPSNIILEMNVLKDAIETLMRSPDIKSSDFPVSALTGKISAEVAIRAARAASKTGPMTSSPTEVRYEIVCPSDLIIKDDVDAARVLALENRLAGLEAQVGATAISRLPFVDVSAGLEELSLRLSALDAQQLEAVNRKARNMIGEVDDLAEAVGRLTTANGNNNQNNPAGSQGQVKFDVDGGDEEEFIKGVKGNEAANVLSVDLSHVAKVNAIYNLCYEWRLLGSSLPLIATRLRTLKAVHQNSVNVIARVHTLEVQQRQLGSLLETAFESLETTQEGIKKALESMAKSAEVLESRMAQLEIL